MRKSIIPLIVISILAGAVFIYIKGISKKTQHNTNIILITIDALRPNHLGCYGYPKNISPAIDKIAKEGTVFRNTFAQSSWTAASMVSMFTSTLPPTHGIFHGQVIEDKVYYQEVLSDDFTTLPEILKSAGYTTAGFSTNSHLTEKQGFAQGFDYFNDNCLWQKADCVNSEAINWIKDNSGEKFFLWIHYIDPHAEFTTENVDWYNPPEKYSKMYRPNNKNNAKEKHIAGYDGEIRYTDDSISELIDALKSQGVYDNSIIIITADHGEGFQEHNQWFHSETLYNEEIHIPLIIRLPRGSGLLTEVDANVRSIDIYPTITDYLNIKTIPQLQGESLIPFIQGKLISDLPVYAETRKKLNQDIRTIIRDGYKLIKNFETGKNELYNLKDDPLEKNNIAEKEKALSERLLNEILSIETLTLKTSLKAGKLEEKDMKEIEKLKSLGYLQ